MKKLLLILGLGYTFSVFAQTPLIYHEIVNDLQSDETYHYPDYFQVKEDPRLQNINLLAFVHIERDFPKPAEPYNRDRQFGPWLRDTAEGGCLDTRGKVLVRDSSTSVTYRPSGCTVAYGNWDDPYTGRQFRSASEIQIDHFVPLKNAYMTGGFEWDADKRCLYANYMGNEFHLLAVSGKENIKKSDRAPSQYMPRDLRYGCTYLKQWLQVKTIWALRLTPKETRAIQKLVDERKCDRSEFVLPMREIQDQRRYMSDHANLCQLARH